MQSPRAYAELHAAGRFRYWPAMYNDLDAATREALYQANRRNVLWMKGIEWEYERSPDVLASEPEPADGLVEIAGDGAGDRFCWYPPWQDGPEPPVLLVPHDEDHARLYAPDFARMLERLWLNNGANSPHDEATRLDLAAWLDIIAPYLSPELASARTDLLAAPPQAFADAEAVLIAGFAPRKLPIA